MSDSTVIATYDTRTAAEVALQALERAGLGGAQLSIVGRDVRTEQHAIGFYTGEDRMKLWARHGALWGALCGVVFGALLFIAPGADPVSVSSSLLDGLFGAVGGGAGGLVCAAVAGMMIPEERGIRYASITTGTFCVHARGSSELTARARSVLGVMPSA